MICKVRQQFISKANTPRAHSGPVRIFGAVWGVWGVAEFKLRLQADFFSHFTRHTPQAGVRRIKMTLKWEPKSMQNLKKSGKGMPPQKIKISCEKSSAVLPPKIDSWAPWGAVLADLGEGGWLETSKYQADLT